MEACQGSICEEPRDKVYAFLGIAHDCEDGQFPVDYTKPLFGLYEDVIQFHLESPGGSETAVKFSQLVQRLLGGSEAMHRDLKNTNLGFLRNIDDYIPKQIEVQAKYGTLTLVGPYYEDFIAFPEATRRWKRAISTYPWDSSNSALSEKQILEQLRKKNENLISMVLDWDPSYTNKMAFPTTAIFWDGTPALNEVDVSDMISEMPLEPKVIQYVDYHENKKAKEDQPRLFSTSVGVIGLMPPGTRPSDTLVRFHKSDLALVCRLTQVRYTHDDDIFEAKKEAKATIIGYALIAGEEEEPYPQFGKTPRYSDYMEGKATINMDFRFLQLLTSS